MYKQYLFDFYLSRISVSLSELLKFTGLVIFTSVLPFDIFASMFFVDLRKNLILYYDFYQHYVFKYKLEKGKETKLLNLRKNNLVLCVPIGYLRDRLFRI